MVVLALENRLNAEEDALRQRFEELAAALQELGYAREEVLALCGLAGARPGPGRLQAAVGLLERHLEFARKCVAVVRD